MNHRFKQLKKDKMKTQKNYNVSIETNDNSENFASFTTLKEAIKHAVRIRNGSKLGGVKEYKEHDNAQVSVYNTETGKDCYCKPICKKYLGEY